MQGDENSPKTTALGGYHNIDEFGFYNSLTKRDFFIILREILISDTKKPLESWTDKADQELKKLRKYGIK
jgi:hypothetical protein